MNVPPVPTPRPTDLTPVVLVRGSDCLDPDQPLYQVRRTRALLAAHVERGAPRVTWSARTWAQWYWTQGEN